jgi:hypothetical protein
MVSSSSARRKWWFDDKGGAAMFRPRFDPPRRQGGSSQACDRSSPAALTAACPLIQGGINDLALHLRACRAISTGSRREGMPTSPEGTASVRGKLPLPSVVVREAMPGFDDHRDFAHG